MDSPNPSEADIKVSIPAQTFRSQSQKVYYQDGKKKYISLVKKVKKNEKNKMDDFKYETNMEIINIHCARAHFININNSSLVFILWK